MCKLTSIMLTAVGGGMVRLGLLAVICLCWLLLMLVTWGISELVIHLGWWSVLPIAAASYVLDGMVMAGIAEYRSWRN